MGKKLTIITLMVLALVLGLAAAASADPGLIISTSYPGVNVVAGETVTFPLEVKNAGLASQKFELSLVSGPKDWTTNFRGSGMQVNQVFVTNGKSEFVDFQVEIPADAKPGKQNFVVQAATAGGTSSSLELSIQVKDSKSGSDKLVTQYPSLSGPSDATFKFRVDLTNSSPQERSYSLSAQAPEGWQVTITPAYEDKQIASISLKAGANQGLDFNVKPPAKIKAGKYEIPVQATSAGGKAMAVLIVNVTGTYKLEVSTPSGRLNAEATAGSESPVTLELRNNGSTDITRINLSAFPPDKWSVTFKPDAIDVLKAGEKKQVTAFVKPDSRAIAGDYALGITASGQETSADAAFRVAVKTPTLWGLIGALVVALVIAGIGWTFYKHGRR